MIKDEIIKQEQISMRIIRTEQQIKQNVSKAFKRCRIEKSLTAEALGYEIGLSQSHVSKIENGSVGCSTATWCTFCEFSGTSLDEAFIGRVNFNDQTSKS